MLEATNIHWWDSHEQTKPSVRRSKLLRLLHDHCFRCYKSHSACIHVTAIVLQAVISESPQLRYTVGNDADTILQAKRTMSDAEFGDFIKQQFILSQSWLDYKSILISTD